MASVRYTEYGPWLQRQLGMKVQKISIHAGFTCPNRDGTVGVGGCTYCNNQTFNPDYCAPAKSVAQQLEEGKRFFARKYPEMRYLAYFQAYTNTYGKPERVRELYEEALGVDGVEGIVIGTRPDCMPGTMLDMIDDLHRRTFVMVEYGIESASDTTLARINRGHTHAQTADAIRRTAARGIRVGGHVILGLPGETRNDILHTAETLSALPLDTLKLHQLQLIKGTRMAKEYAECPEDFMRMTAAEYADLVIDFMERVCPDLVMERFVSQSPANLLAEPGWGLKNHEFTALVRKRLDERDTWQGRLAGAPRP